MRAEVGPPFELPAAALRLRHDHVRHLPRQAGNAERRGVDDLDPLDARRGNPPQLVDRTAGLVGDALAVDQYVLRCLPEPALLVRLADREARHLDQHVVGSRRREPGEVGRGIDLLARAVRGRRRLARHRGWRVAGFLRHGGACVQCDPERQRARPKLPIHGYSTPSIARMTRAIRRA
jgi:hypothetical protein